MAVTITPLPGVVPLTIAPVTPMFAVPAKVTVTGVTLAERVIPPISRVFPAPLAVIVLPDEVLLYSKHPSSTWYPLLQKLHP